MSDLQVILFVAATAAGLLVSTVTFVVKFLKSTRAKRAAEEIVKIGCAILPFVQAAEAFAGYTGSEKKEFVLTKANQFAIDNGMEFNVEQVSAKIEELVSLTKSVNKREKDKLCAASSVTAGEYAQCMNGKET